MTRELCDDIMNNAAEEFAGQFGDIVREIPLFVPDLTLWFEWHQRENTLPAPTLNDVAEMLGLRCWSVKRPWIVNAHRVEMETRQTDEQKTVLYHTPSGTLQSRWMAGPDGDFWQMEYPVKGIEDLSALEDIAGDRTYTMAPVAPGTPISSSTTTASVIEAMDLPLSPYSMLVYEFLGLSEGLMILWDAGDKIAEIIRLFGESYLAVAAETRGFPGSFVVLPDNLDSQFISPDSFHNHYLECYSSVAEICHEAQKKVIVHAGGPVGSLLADLGRSGLDGIEGIAGQPQGDTDLTSARQAVGAGMTLWGGIPQDLFLDTYEWGAFEKEVIGACRQVAGQTRMILGVADKVPPQASLDRLSAVPGLVEEHTRRE